MGSLVFLVSLHPTTLQLAVESQTKARLLPYSKCAELKLEVWNVQDLQYFWILSCCYWDGLNIFLQNRWSKMWFTVVCAVFMREFYGICKAERGCPGSSVGFVHEGSDALVGKGDGGFCKIIWPNLMYLTSGKLLQWNYDIDGSVLLTLPC